MSGDLDAIDSRLRGMRKLAVAEPNLVKEKLDEVGSEGDFFPENQRQKIIESILSSDSPKSKSSPQNKQIDLAAPVIEQPLKYRELLDYLITYGATQSPIPYEDCVYGRQWINPVEQRLIVSAPFLRLDDVSQMTAQYTARAQKLDNSRLEHSISAMFAGEYCGRRFEFKDETVQALRILCLSHDLGHAPFSHLVENLHGRRRGAGFDHEDVVEERLSHPQVKGILAEIGLTPERIAEILKDKKNPIAFIESELCDRVQYLLDGAQRSGFSSSFKAKINSGVQRYVDSHVFSPDGDRVCIMGDRLDAAMELVATRNAWHAEYAVSGSTTLVNKILVEELLRIEIERAKELQLDRETDFATEESDRKATFMCSEEDVVPELSHEARVMLASRNIEDQFRALIGIKFSDLNERGLKFFTDFEKSLGLEQEIRNMIKIVGADEILHGAVIGQTRLEPKVLTFKSFHPVESLPDPRNREEFQAKVRELEGKLREEHERIQADFYIPDRGNPSLPSLKIDSSKVVTLFAGTKMPDGSRLEYDMKGYIGDFVLDGTVGPGQSTFFVAVRRDLPIDIQGELEYRLKCRLTQFMNEPETAVLTMHRDVFGPVIAQRYNNHTRWSAS